MLETTCIISFNFYNISLLLGVSYAVGVSITISKQNNTTQNKTKQNKIESLGNEVTWPKTLKWQSQDSNPVLSGLKSLKPLTHTESPSSSQL